MRAIILDRDGVINHDSDDFIKSPEEWLPIPGSIRAIAKLFQAGFAIFVVTNQSGLARKLFDETTLAAMHAKLRHEVSLAGGKITDIIYCPHAAKDQCLCRKPKTGMLQKIEQDYQINLAQAFFIGDSQSDIDAAKAHGCVPILVKTGKGERTLQAKANPNVAVYADLAHAIETILLT